MTRRASYLFVKDETTQQGGALLGSQVIEDTSEDHFRQQQLVSRTDLARDPSFLFDDSIVRRESQPPQCTRTVPQFVEVHDRVSSLNLLLRRADLEFEGLFRTVLVVEGREVRVRVKRV